MPRWWSSWCCASVQSRRSVPRSAASMRPAKRRGWQRVGTTGRHWRPPAASHRLARRCRPDARADSSSRPSPPGQCCCPVSPSPRKPWRRSSHRSDSERGSATVTAAFAAAVLMTLGVAGVQIGGAVVARHRAQAAADLAALAAAAALPAGSAAACARAEQVAAAMSSAPLLDCHIDDLDVVIAVTLGPGACRCPGRSGRHLPLNRSGRPRALPGRRASSLRGRSDASVLLRLLREQSGLRRPP